MNKVYYLPVVFLLSLAGLGATLFSIHSQLKSVTEIFLPTSLDSLKVLCESLIKCYDDYPLSIHLFHGICFLFLQTWCIPGTVLFNLFGGAVFGVYKGTILCLLFNVLGATLSYTLSKLFLGEVFDSNLFLKGNKEKLKKLMDNNKGDLIFYLIFLRLFPGSPNWVMNICFPHLNIGYLSFAFSVFVGIAPWNFFSCSAGSILKTLTTTKEIMDSKQYYGLIAMALCFLVIPIVRSKFKKYSENKIE